MVISHPRVTIIMATYNRAHFILESLQSIQKQTFKDWECLIVDDGGTDNTLAVITPILENDNRFKYLKRTGNYIKGLPGCRNYGIDIAKGDYIIFFDDDDIVHPDCLNFSFTEIENGKVDYCRFLRSVFYGNNIPRFELEKNYTMEILGKNIYEHMIMGSIPFNSCQILWKKSCFKNERFNEKLMFAEEWELYSRILSHKIKGVNLNIVLYFGRKHPNSNTGEFYNNDPIRRNSKIRAVKLVVDNLLEKNLLTLNLVHYFIRTGFFLQDFSIINHTLKSSKASFLTTMKYKLGFQFYAVIKPVLKLKGKFKKTI